MKRLIVASLIAVALFVIAGYLRSKDVAVPPSQSERARTNPLPTAKSRGAMRDIAKSTSNEHWDRFRERFGKELVARFSSDGKLALVRKGEGPGVSGGADYDSNDPQDVIARAKEILEAAGPMIGIKKNLPLENPIAKTGEYSAQVYFQETFFGMPLAPHGGVTVNLGPRGELLALESNYVSAIHATNSPRISSIQAEEAANAALATHDSLLKVEGGYRVAWLKSMKPNAGNRKVEARHAYEFSVQGRQIVVDAETGEILYQRDRRIFQVPESR